MKYVERNKEPYRARRIVLVVACLVAALIVGCSATHDDETRTLASLRQMDDHPLYSMRYYGDYGFQDFLQKGIRAPTSWQRSDRQARAAWACTCFAALNPDGDLLFGRNFDWTHRATLLLFTDPPDGYASVSMVDIHYLGYGEGVPSGGEQAATAGGPLLAL